MEQLIKIGSVHGRFQPFHNGHLDYVLQAFSKADFIYVGLTQIFRPDASDLTALGRDSWRSNPLSFWQRSDLVDVALTSNGIPRNRFRIIPFPIELPSRLLEFIPSDSTCFTTRVDIWNDEKIQRLQAAGFAVEVLATSPQDGTRVASGSKIRQMIRDHEKGWEALVPEAVAKAISPHMLERIINGSGGSV